jgi:hypothetical protein
MVCPVITIGLLARGKIHTGYISGYFRTSADLFPEHQLRVSNYLRYVPGGKGTLCCLKGGQGVRCSRSAYVRSSFPKNLRGFLVSFLNIAAQIVPTTDLSPETTPPHQRVLEKLEDEGEWKENR